MFIYINIIQIIKIYIKIYTIANKNYMENNGNNIIKEKNTNLRKVLRLRN